MSGLTTDQYNAQWRRMHAEGRDTNSQAKAQWSKGRLTCLHFVLQYETPRSGRSRALSRQRGESNPVEQAENPDNPVEEAAAEAVQKKLDEQPSPVVEPKQPRYEEEDDEDFTDGVRELEWRAADAAAQIQGHKFGKPWLRRCHRRQSQAGKSPRRERGSPSMMAPVSRSSPSWSCGRTTPSKTELTGEEMAFCREQNLDLEEYRRNKAKMMQMKAAGVIQE